MAIFKAKVPPVLTQLDAKGAKLENSADAKLSTADALIRQAADLRSEAGVNAAHAEAVRKAQAILDEAGVSI